MHTHGRLIDDTVFSGFNRGYKVNPNRLINLKGFKETPLSTCSSLFFLSRNSYCQHTILQCVLHGMQIHPPQVSRIRQGCPFTRARQFWSAIPIQLFARGATRLYPCSCSHSMRPCLMSFWYQRPCHFCRSPVYCRSWRGEYLWAESFEPHTRRRG